MAAAVAPHVGAWIETRKTSAPWIRSGVAPHVGAWIETMLSGRKLPNWYVAPHVGAWIETRVTLVVVRRYHARRAPRGRVD